MLLVWAIKSQGVVTPVSSCAKTPAGGRAVITRNNTRLSNALRMECFIGIIINDRNLESTR